MKFLNLLIVFFLFYNFGGSSSSSCGELHNITYPYRLPLTCQGKAGPELQCDGNDTVLYIAATKYIVKDMSIENYTLTLVDPDLAVGGCRLPKQTISWDQYFILLGECIFSADGTLIYFFDCTEEVEDSMYKLIHCMDGPRSRVYAAIYPYPSEIFVSNTPKSCRYVGSTLAVAELKYRWKEIDDADMMQMLRQGFVATWMTMTPFSYPPPIEIRNMSFLLKYCWSSSKSEFNYKSLFTPTGDKLRQLLHKQSSFLHCTYNPQNIDRYDGPDGQYAFATFNTHVVFYFMLILLPLLEILLVLLGRLPLLSLAIFLFLLHKYKRVSLSTNSIEKFLRKHEMLSVRRYDFTEIAIITNHFREKLGQGGFGSVYKGKC